MGKGNKVRKKEVKKPKQDKKLVKEAARTASTLPPRDWTPSASGSSR
jgi:hypothetical protein